MREKGGKKVQGSGSLTTHHHWVTSHRSPLKCLLSSGPTTQRHTSPLDTSCFTPSFHSTSLSSSLISVSLFQPLTYLPPVPTGSRNAACQTITCPNQFQADAPCDGGG